MSFQEKSNWIMLAIMAGVYGWYFGTVASSIGENDVTEIPYQGRMLVTVVALVVLAAAAHAVVAIASPKDADASDERDRVIDRRGEYIGGFALGAASLLAMGLAMLEFDHFWIANTILAGLVASELVSGVTKAVLYRRGF